MDEQPVNKEQWYIVAGRIPFDDEDTSHAVFAVSENEARTRYKEMMLESNEPVRTPSGEPVVLINTIWCCGDTEPKLLYTV